MREQCKKSCNYCDYEIRCKPFEYRESALNITDYALPSLYDKLFYGPNGILSSSEVIHFSYNLSQ